MTHLSAAAIVFAVLVRLVSTHARFPWWELDPSRQIVPETALLPSQALMLDIVVWIAAFVGVGACVMLGRPLRWVTGVLVLIGAAGAHTTSIFMGARAGSGPDDAVTASAWSSAMVGAWAMTHLAADAAIRRRVFAVFAGAAWVLAAKGAYQVFVEHPAMVAHYKANAEAMLAAQGLEPGGAGAREFERRLMQPEATGWVGMSNAHASILAAMLAMTAAQAWSAWGEVRKKTLASGTAGLLTLGALAAAVGLLMTFSKGGVVAGVLALGVTVGAAWWIRRGASGVGGAGRIWERGWLLVVVAVGLPVIAIAAVCVRGAFGESLGERSLLFRWQYLVGATRIIEASLPWGVGPGGFKAAYALHKPVLSPETVESPHSVLFDWVACLGVFGVAWCAVLFAWLGGAGRAALGWCGIGGGACTEEEHASQGGSMAPGEGAAAEVRAGSAADALWLLTPVIACAVAWIREGPTVGPDEWLVRVVAMIAWVATVYAAARVSVGHVVASAVFGGAVALATHGQIELTPILPATCATVFLLVGLAAACGSAASVRGHSSKGSLRLARVLAVSPLLLLFPFAVRTLAIHSRVSTWEVHLEAAAETVRPVARIRALLPQLAENPDAKRELESILFGSQPEGTRRSLGGPIAARMSRAAELAERQLRIAWDARPEVQRVDDAALRVMVGVALDAVSLGEQGVAGRLIEIVERRIEWMDRRPYNWSRRGGGAAAVASAYQAMQQIAPEPDGRYVQQAVELWEKAAEIDPTALAPVLRLVDLYESLGREVDVVGTAKRALELNQNLRLDPLKQLSEGQRKRLEGLAAGATGVAPAAEPKP